MIDLHLLDEETVLREYMAERHRRLAVPSLSGVEPDMPRSTSPPSGRWEGLILLTKGAPPEGIELEYSRFTSRAGYKHVPWGDTGKLTIEIAIPLNDAELASKHGIAAGRVRALRASVLRAIAVNLGRLRGMDRHTVASQREYLLVLAKRVLPFGRRS